MNDFALTLLMLGAMSSGSQLPFWATANQFGLMPEGSGGLAMVQAGTQYDTSRDFQWKWGVSLAANLDARIPAGTASTGRTADFNLMADELYASMRYKKFNLDAGMKRVDLDFLAAGSPTLGSMSVTGGNVIWSGNARTMPGYLLSLDPVPVPLTNNVVWLYGAYGDYKTLDNRYVKGALLHRTKVFLKFCISPRLDFHFGIEDAALWGGVSPKHGAMPVTLGNYLRIITGSSASSEGTEADQINVLGDHRGATMYRLDYRGDGWKAAAQHHVQYDDGSGILGYQNFPDGINTLWFGFDDKSRWVSDIVYEYHYTMKQSGTAHDRPTTEEERSKMDPSDPHYYKRVLGGNDNYFNNGYFKSGWTHFGHTIGNPLFFPAGTRDGSWSGRETVLGVENNRFKAHHLGIAGSAFHKFPYKLMLTYSRNYGKYTKPYEGVSQYGKPWGTVKETPLHQVSAALIGEIPFGKSGLNMTYGLYADRGQLLQDVFGATLGLRWNFR